MAGLRFPAGLLSAMSLNLIDDAEHVMLLGIIDRQRRDVFDDHRLRRVRQRAWGDPW